MTGRLLVIEHDADCPAALMDAWLADAGCTLDVVRPYAGDPLPDLTSYDGFVVLGGPMGADDDAKHDWLGPVKELLREAQGNGLPTLGICLGHQLIASALGGRVGRNPRGQQVGLLDVGWTDAAAGDALMGPLATPRRGVQWNDDLVLALPEGATLLAETPYGEVQAVRYGPAMWGVQLHPEVDAAGLATWADEDRTRHGTVGIDTDAAIREIDAARAELDEAWRPLATGFAALVR
ncbi:type 1 glutamine amidotransferase [Nocardioides hankookensis]|uniref:Type 1 glutamine amidotransferase n=1 Tax=Nocardioides hankookensis TaxID=443157 RepID=A0ABW1LMR6_9ACTN